MSDHDNLEPPAYDDINTSAVILTGVIAAVVTLMTIYFVQGVAGRWQNSVLDQRSLDGGPTSMPAYQQIQDQKDLLAGGNGTKSIDEAMEVVITKYGK